MSPAHKRGFFFGGLDCNPTRAPFVQSCIQARWPEGPHMKSATLVVFALVAIAAWAGSPASLAGDGRDISSVNGSVKASPGETYDSVSAVNGNVRVGSSAIVDTAKTVNGEIKVESNAKLGEVKTVNGSLDIGDDVVIERSATTVNGSVELGRRTRVAGDVSTVSGQIDLKGAEVGGKLTTRNGDIELTDGARVRGGIHVKTKNDSNWGWNGKDGEPIKVHICSTCTVDGELRFDRPVELHVENGAKIGKVIGDQVTRR
jgi:cytoskeletal protein CcmA (bactofilin family)